MSVISQSIPNFINGMSQQTPTQRNVTQGADQLNMQSNLIEGLTKRPSLEFVADLGPSFSSNTLVHPIKRDESREYAVAIQSGDIKVFGLDGTEYPVSYPDGTSYLNVTNPRNEIKLVNVADYTFIANTNTTIAADSSTTADKVKEFLVYCNTSNYGREYVVEIGHTDFANTIQFKFQMPTGNDASTDSAFRDTDKIIDILLYGTSSTHYNAAANGIGYEVMETNTNTVLSTSAGLTSYTPVSSRFSFEKYKSTIYGTLVDQTKDFSVETSDGQGNKAMYAIISKVQDFSKLPYYAKEGMIIEITGDEGDTLTNYFIEFKGNGVWEEVIAPSTSVGLDNSTMPHALINNNDGTFTFRQIDWSDRNAGSEETNPNPTFVGLTVNNLTFYKNRLGILSGENLILTGNGDFFNFFATTVTQTLDTDPIDIAASGTNVNTLRHAISFNQTLLLFSDTDQFVLESSGDSPTPTSAVLNKTSAFDVEPNSTPVSAGKFVYFTQSRGNNTAVREYYADNDTLTNDSLNISIAVENLIPKNVFKTLANSTEDTLMFMSSETPDYLYIYKYFFDNNAKVQSAWSKWQFNNLTMLGGLSDESVSYFIANDIDARAKLFSIDLRNIEETNLDFSVSLDHKARLTSGSYNSTTDKTTFTVPYNYKSDLYVVDAVTGVQCEIASYSLTDLVIEGNHTSIIIGCKFDSSYKLSPQFVREQGANGSTISITSGRYQLRTISFDYEDTNYFTVEVDSVNRGTSTYEFSGNVIGVSSIETPNLTSGSFLVPIQSENTAVDITVKSDSYLPLKLTSAEVEGFYHRRSARR